MAQTTTSSIELIVQLDENRVPEKLCWSAADGGIFNQETNAFLLSVWDGAHKETLKIDLWTKDMPQEEMRIFFHQTLLAMADTFYKATNDDKMADSLRDFCEYFAEKSGLKKKSR